MATMMDYIYEEEATLLAILAHFKTQTEVSLSRIENIVILATGSSYNACLAAKPFFEKVAKVTLSIEEPYHFNHYGNLSKKTDLVIAVSQSGKSASTIDALTQATKVCPTIVLTSDLTSPITRVAQRLIDLEMGIETVGFVTKGYVVTVLQLFLLALQIGENKQVLSQQETIKWITELRGMVLEIPRIITQTLDFFAENQAIFKMGQRFIAIGYGANWGTAKEFETKFTETVREPSQGFELESYMHGPYLEANSRHILFFIENESPNLSRSQKLKGYMAPYIGQELTITTQASNEKTTLGLSITCHELVSSLLLIIPFQILACKIAASKGIDLDQRIFDDFDQILKSKI